MLPTLRTDSVMASSFVNKECDGSSLLWAVAEGDFHIKSVDNPDYGNVTESAEKEWHASVTVKNKAPDV